MDAGYRKESRSSSFSEKALSQAERQPGYSYLTQTYSRRYLVCLAFAVNNLANAIIWITFAPIQEKTANYLNTSQAMVNLMSMVFMIVYVPGSILCAYCFNRMGLRKSFILAAVIQTLGALIRFLGHSSFVWLFIGQSLVAIVQPFYTNSPSRIPADWFGKKGRDLATAFLSMLNPLGIGVGSMLPSVFITDIDNDRNRHGGYSGLLLTQLSLCIFALLLTLLFHFDKPPKPPSMSQHLKLQQRADTPKKAMRQLLRDARFLYHNSQFLILTAAFGIGLGLFNGMTTLINQWASAAGEYSSANAGIFAGLMVAGGLLGAVTAGVLMDATHNYKEIYRAFASGTVIVFVFLTWQFKPHNLVVVDFLFALLGFFSLPIVAITFECGVECTYPVSEELTNGVLMAVGCFAGVLQVLIWGGRLPKTKDSDDSRHYGDSIKNFSSLWIYGNLGVLLVLVFCYNGEYYRLQAECSGHLRRPIVGDCITDVSHLSDDTDDESYDYSLSGEDDSRALPTNLQQSHEPAAFPETGMSFTYSLPKEQTLNIMQSLYGSQQGNLQVVARAEDIADKQ